MTDLIIGVTTRHVPSPKDLQVPFDGVLSGFSSALYARGALPMLVPMPAPAPNHEARAARVVRTLDGLILSGGEDPDPRLYGQERVEGRPIAPERDAWEIVLYRAARAARVPVLGVCRGAQLINVSCGGTLRFHEGHYHPPFDQPSHGVTITPGTFVERAVGGPVCTVNSAHKLAIADVGRGLRVAAESGDGAVEAVESEDGLVVGVQWHPELLASNRPASRIGDAFLKLATERRTA